MKQPAPVRYVNEQRNIQVLLRGFFHSPYFFIIRSNQR